MSFTCDADKKKYVGAIEEIVNSMARMQAEAELISEICKQAKDTFDIAPADTKKVAKIRFDRNIEEAKKKALEPIESYQELFKD